MRRKLFEILGIAMAITMMVGCGVNFNSSSNAVDSSETMSLYM